MGEESLEARLAALLSFTGAAPLTGAVGELERALENCRGDEVAACLSEAGVSEALLRSALFARSQFGRINDVIHAVAIALVLPRLLEPDERLERPSLAAGNDPSRPFDIESDLRAAEFKLSLWTGHDAGRKRQLFKDLVHLAAADIGGRRVEMYVLGTRPMQFLTTTSSTANWALNRMADKTKVLFSDRFGSTEIPIPQFVETHAAHVAIIDLEQRFPDLFGQQ